MYGETYEFLKSFCYLGDTLDGDGGADLAVTARNGWLKFREILPFLTSRTSPLEMKGQVYDFPTPLPNTEQTNVPSSNHTYTKSTPNHIHHHYASLQHPHTSYLQLHPHTHHTVTPGFGDRPRWSDGVAGHMERYAGWWTKSGTIELPPQTRVKGVGRHNNQDSRHNN